MHGNREILSVFANPPNLIRSINALTASVCFDFWINPYILIYVCRFFSNPSHATAPLKYRLANLLYRLHVALLLASSAAKTYHSSLSSISLRMLTFSGDLHFSQSSGNNTKMGFSYSFFFFFSLFVFGWFLFCFDENGVFTLFVICFWIFSAFDHLFCFDF